jgi:class 3 adenylate cyclase
MAEPAGVVTFLLTDVEGSTPLWEREPAEMGIAVRLLDEAVAAVADAAGGRLVKARGEGDSHFVVFQRAAGAVGAAWELHRALASTPWPTGDPLIVRIALHTGEAHLRDGDYYGPVVNRCARLRALAHGGQTVLSEATAALARGALPEGARLDDLGEYRLRGIDTPERVFQLTDPADAEFPPLRSLAVLTYNLPEALGPFVGREAEIADVRQALDRSRLVTLTGSAGSGKTRLAIRVATEALDRFGDGAWFVDLAPIVEPHLVVEEVARAMGVRSERGTALIDTLLDVVGARSLLVILDNCEHLSTPLPRLRDDSSRSARASRSSRPAARRCRSARRSRGACRR